MNVNNIMQFSEVLRTSMEINCIKRYLEDSGLSIEVNFIKILRGCPEPQRM